MALIKCPECGKEISDKASACIHCGYPLANTQKKVAEKISSQPSNSISNEKNKMITRLYDIGYSRKDVLECMKYYKDDIIKYMELKNIQNEYGKLRYIFTVVENNIKDFSTREIDAPVMQEEVKIEEEPVYVPIKTHKRRSLKDRLKEG